MKSDEQHLTKKELKILKKLEKLDLQKETQQQNKVKWIAISLVSLAFLGFFIFLLAKGKEKNNQPVNISLSQNDLVKGNSDAKATLIEFGDFQCPACKRYEPWVQELSKSYPKDLRLVFKHFPLENAHPNALAGALAAEAAGKQNKFWEMHDMLYDKQEEWSNVSDPRELFASYALALKLNTDQFKKDMASSDLEKKIHAQRDEGIKLGVGATPTFFLNNVQLDSPASLEDFKKLIEDVIK